MALCDPSSQGLLGGRTVKVGILRPFPALTQHRAPQVPFLAVAEVLAGILPTGCPDHCFLHGQRKGSL